MSDKTRNETETENQTNLDQDNDPGRSYTRPEAAAYLGISEPFLRKLDLSNQGPAYIRIGRRWTYLREDLDAFRLRHRRDPAATELREVA